MQGTKLAALALAIVTIALPAAVAQKGKDSSTRSVGGVVTDAGDKPVTGAVVQLKDLKTKNVRSFYTQAKGDYYFHELSTETDYELTATYRGETSKSKTLSVFDTRKDAVVNLKLEGKK